MRIEVAWWSWRFPIFKSFTIRCRFRFQSVRAYQAYSRLGGIISDPKVNETEVKEASVKRSQCPFACPVRHDPASLNLKKEPLSIHSFAISII